MRWRIFLGPRPPSIPIEVGRGPITFGLEARALIDIKTIKRRLRREVLARILAMDPADRRAQQTALVERFLTLPGFASARTVLLYVSAFAEEVETRPLLIHALKAGKRLVLPRVDEVTRSLLLHEVADLDRNLEAGRRGIPEPSALCPVVDPAEVDWVLVPGLAFDRRGFRLGRGAGHYDRLLPNLRPDALSVAIILETQWVDQVPTEPHDRPVDGVANHLGFTGR